MLYNGLARKRTTLYDPSVNIFRLLLEGEPVANDPLYKLSGLESKHKLTN